MREDAISIEESRIGKIRNQDEYDMVHERHRIFPNVFEDRKHKKIIDISSGVGIVGKRIQNNYTKNVVCNDISPSCIKILQKAGLETLSFDLDNENEPFPIKDNTFDAVISLATIEHIIHIDHFMNEINRIIQNGGYLYLSAPNYNGIFYVLPLLLNGKTFHDPLDEKDKYEFYAHVRYFTLNSLIKYVCSFNFETEKIYAPIPKSSTKYFKLYQKSKFAALFFKIAMVMLYKTFGARWHSEPVICFKKSTSNKKRKVQTKLI
jgi:2-polyprenyl-3-methyl-5-hydroxy-6-metoxy-1,4-benzoquinol methylase